LPRIVDHSEVLNAIAAGAQVADVLPASEFRSAHIRGAAHLPLPKLIHQARQTLDPARPVVVYCRDCL
jgi:rhodanese-related sulfurtransferase